MRLASWALTQPLIPKHTHEFLMNNLISQQTKQLADLLNSLHKVNIDKDLSAFLNKVKPWLPTYKGQSFSCQGHERLKELHKKLSYLLALHPSIQQQHPLFFWHQKERIRMIWAKISPNEYIEHWVNQISPYFYRVSDLASLKDTTWSLVSTMDKLYEQDDFLKNNLNELILADLLKNHYFPESDVWVASNVDDRRYGFDTVMIDQKKNVTFIDFTFNDDQTIVEKKQKKIAEFVQEDDRLYDTEFALYLYEKYGLVLKNLSRKWIVWQVDRGRFTYNAIRPYLLQVNSETLVSNIHDSWIKFLEYTK
jgi:hypothetical protein